MAEPTLHEWTAGDGYVWRYRRYDPTVPPRASVVALHGIQSHGGWYEQSCGQLCNAGYAVSFLDRRGCGLNQRDRGDAPSFRRLLDDIAEFLHDQPWPVVLVGISWGGKLAAAFSRRHPGLIDGLVLIAPGLRPRVKTRLDERVRIIACRLLAPRTAFPIPLNDPELFTANLDRQRFIRDDQLALCAATARLLFESARLDVYLRFAAKAVTMPVLLLLAGQDRIIDNAATRQYVERFAATDRTVIDYPGAHHTLEFEPDGPPFVDDLLKWLKAHTD